MTPQQMQAQADMARVPKSDPRPYMRPAAPAPLMRPTGKPSNRMEYKKGGSASSRADGIATKGKTRGKMC